MAQTSPVSGWDALLHAQAETTFGTTPAPASTSAWAALAISCVNPDLGGPEQGDTRPQKDRPTGRMSTRGFVEGRVQPMPFNVESTLRARSAIDVAAQEAVLYRAGGLKQTLNGSTSAVYTLVSDPIVSADFVSASLSRFLGSHLVGSVESPDIMGCDLSETLRGCVVRTLRWEGGDKEVTLRAEGAGIGKYSRGPLESITLANGSVTSLTHTAEESYRLDQGYFLCEDEIISIAARSDVGYGSTASTIARGALGTSGAAHTAKALWPAKPKPTWAGAPLSESTCTVSIGGVTFRVMSWWVELATGMDLLPGQSGSAYIQGAKATRYDVRISVRLVLTLDGISLLGKLTKRATAGALAFSLAQGTGAGGVITFAGSFAELAPFQVPSPPTDITIIDLSLRVRENAGNDALTITLT